MFRIKGWITTEHVNVTGMVLRIGMDGKMALGEHIGIRITHRRELMARLGDYVEL